MLTYYLLILIIPNRLSNLYIKQYDNYYFIKLNDSVKFSFSFAKKLNSCKIYPLTIILRVLKCAVIINWLLKDEKVKFNFLKYKK